MSEITGLGTTLLGGATDGAFSHRARAQPAVERERSIVLATLFLAILSTLGVVVLEWSGATRGLPPVVDAVFVAIPVMGVLSHVLARVGYGFAAGAATMATAAASVIGVAQFAPALLPAASLYLLLAALLVLSGQVMPFEVAAGLGLVNILLTLALPNFLPVGGADAVKVPYVFLFINAPFILFTGILRMRDQAALAAADRQVATVERRASELAENHRLAQGEHASQLSAAADQARGDRDLLHVASHELRTPITPLVVQMAAFRLRYADGMDPDQLRAVDLLERNLKRMARLVDALLDVARLDNDGVELTLAEVALDRMFVDARHTFEHQATERGISLVMSVPDVSVVADGPRLSQVISNLVSNAIKFSPPGGIVAVQAQFQGPGLQISVRDQGPGLTPGQIAGLFKPFAQVHDAANGPKGTGLGLYISSRIVDQHGGKIWAQSAGPGHGSTFGFWLPGSAVRETPPAPK